MNNNYVKFIASFGISIGTLLVLTLLFVVIIDPFFHYHQPNNLFSYELKYQRYQNDGILKNFNYNGIITGSSMTENFFKSEADDIFNANFIKVPFSGGSYKEIDENINRGILKNKNIKYVIRGLDYWNLFQTAGAMRDDLGSYPTYLYDNSILNDIKYIYNIDTIGISGISLLKSLFLNKHGIINNFDSYSYWMPNYTFGKNAVLKEIDNFVFATSSDIEYVLSDKEKAIINENIEKNVLKTAKENPQISFYYFFTPYSIAWWGKIKMNNELNKFLSAEKYIIEKILPINNIYLFSFNNFFDITTNLNNYKDLIHYGEWINTDILNYMKNNVGRLSKNNYINYINKEKAFYQNFDYNSLFNQIDEPDKELKIHN